MIKRISIYLLGMIALSLVGLVMVYADQIIPYSGTGGGGGGTGTPGGEYLDLQYNNGAGAFGGWGVGNNLSVAGGKLNASLTPAGVNGQLQANKNGALSGVTVGAGLSLANDTLTATGSGGSSVWGAITGTLSDQQDLWGVLGTKMDLVPSAIDGSIPAFKNGGQLKDGSSSYFVGVGPSKLVQLDSLSRLPALDASQLYNLPTAAQGVWGEISGDITRQTDLMTQLSYKLDHIASPRSMAIPTMSADGNLNSGTNAYDVGVSPNNLVKLDSLSRLPAVDGSQLLNVGGGGNATRLYSYDNPSAYMQITGPTAGRTMTIPDSDLKVAGTNLNNTFTAAQLFKEPVTFGEQSIGVITDIELYYSGMGYYLPIGTTYDGSTITNGDGIGCTINPVFSDDDIGDYTEKSVVSVSLLYGGSGYKAGTNVPTTIRASDAYNYSGVNTITITNSGDGYTESKNNVPTKTISGTGVGCIINYTVISGTSYINYVHVSSAGTGYKVGDVIAPLISQAGITTEARFTITSIREYGTGCTLDYTISATGKTSQISLKEGGSGYSPTSDCSTVAVSSKGTGLRIGFTTFGDGAIAPTGYAVTAGGAGYVVGDVITPNVPHEKDAYFSIYSLTPEGQVASVAVHSSGNGYSVGDILTPTATHVHEAEFKVTQVCDFGGIVSVAVTSPGTGYKVGDTISPALDSVHPANIKITEVDNGKVVSTYYDIKAAANAHIDIKYDESGLGYLPSGVISDINGYTYSIAESKDVILPPASYVGANVKFVIGVEGTNLSITTLNKKMYFIDTTSAVHKASAVIGDGLSIGSCVECSTFKVATGYAWLCKAVGGTWEFDVPSNGAATALMLKSKGSGYVANGTNVATKIKSGTGSGLAINYGIDTSGAISTIAITNMGAGYTVGTVVSPVAACSSEATLIVTSVDESNGIVSSVSIANGGQNYAVAKGLSTSQTTEIYGKECTINIDAVTATPSLSGIISAVSVNTGGYGYVLGEQLHVSQPAALGSKNGVLTITGVTSGKSGVAQLNIQDGGAGYQLSPGAIDTMNIDSSGSGCKIQITELGASNTITAIELMAAGTGYKVGDILSPKVSNLGTARLLVVSINPLTGSVTSVSPESSVISVSPQPNGHKRIRDFFKKKRK